MPCSASTLTLFCCVTAREWRFIIADEANAGEFKHWGIWVGGVWSEQVEGTNGIGTCIVDQRPVFVHGNQHFRGRHAQLSCAGAPIFDPYGQLVAVLDVSRVHREDDNRPFPLVLDTTVVSARAIEDRLFREHFRRAWTIAALPSENEPHCFWLSTSTNG